jgi:hypothetical protein
MEEEIKCLNCDIPCKVNVIIFDVEGMSLLGGAYTCPSCNEAYCTSEQMNYFLNRFKELSLSSKLEE